LLYEGETSSPLLAMNVCEHTHTYRCAFVYTNLCERGIHCTFAYEDVYTSLRKPRHTHEEISFLNIRTVLQQNPCEYSAPAKRALLIEEFLQGSFPGALCGLLSRGSLKETYFCRALSEQRPRNTIENE